MDQSVIVSLFLQLAIRTVTHSRFKKLRKHFDRISYEDEDVLIVHGDAVSLIDALPSESINLAVTSPPYNIGKEYESVRPLPDYLSWCSEWLEKLPRILTETGAFWLNLGYLGIRDQGKAIPLSYLLWNRVPLYMIQEVVWNYGAGVAAKNCFSPRNEKFLWYVKDPEVYMFNLDSVRDPNVKYPKQKKNGQLKCNPLGKNPTDVWQIPKVTSGTNRSSKERTPHPAQFPRALIERIVLACSQPGDVIFDPFIGSGTVAEVAIRTGRKVIGFEIDDSYIGIIKERVKTLRHKLAEESRQQSLFVETRPSLA